jgi:plasmid stability protein
LEAKVPSLTLKNIPEQKLAMLKRRAKEHHRSLQGEMMNLIDEALKAPKATLTMEEVYEKVKALGIKSPGDSTRIIREARDNR